jgi:hypothetical protein
MAKMRVIVSEDRGIVMRVIASVIIIIAIVGMSVQPAWGRIEVIRAVVEFEMPSGFFQRVCRKPEWKGVVAKWGGVTDSRGTPFIGKQVKKGGEQIPVISDPPLGKVMNDALKDLFEECGMAFVEKDVPGALNLSVEIKTFDVNVIKNTFSNNAESVSMIRFVAQKGTKSQTIDVGMELESKGAGGGKLKALKKAANRLLLETLEAVPKNEHMRELKTP